MSTIEQPTLDLEKLQAFVDRAVEEVGATLNTALVVMGDKLALYHALAGAGPLTSDELAYRTDTAERYVREWLNAQAAGGYVEYDPATGRYALRLSRPSPSPMSPALRTSRASFKSRWARSSIHPGSPTWPAPVRDSAGESTHTMCSRAANASSDRATVRV